MVCNGDQEIRRRYEAAYNPSVDHDTDVVHDVATRCTEASAVTRTDNQCQMVAHCIIEDTYSGVEGCVDHPSLVNLQVVLL